MKPLRSVTKIAILAAAIVVSLAGLYIVRTIHYEKYFLPNTNVAGISISGKTPSQANALLKRKLNSESFTLKENSKDILNFSGSDVGLSHNFLSVLTKLKNSQDAWTWSLRVFASDTDNQVQDSIRLNKADFEAFFNKTSAELNKGRTQTSNAYIKKNNGTFEIVPEVQGNAFDQTKLRESIQQSLNNGDTTIELKKNYTKPTILSTNAQLQKDVKQLQAIANETITYTIFGSTVTVPKDTLFQWITYSDNKVDLDQSQVAGYVSTLAAKYNTYDKTRQFKSTKRGTVSVPAGIYGWSIKQAAETTALIAEILNGESFTRSPLTQGSGYNTSGIDIGSTYVEVDKTNQHMWVYENGKVVISTDIVTGAPGQETPSGVWNVWSKQRNATLRGKNNDGSNYASPVDYWMPIDTTGVGLHDSPWQSAYGGDRYKTYGSHGCINTPPTVMAKLYDTVKIGTPVLVF